MIWHFLKIKSWSSQSVGSALPRNLHYGIGIITLFMELGVNQKITFRRWCEINIYEKWKNAP